MRAIVFIFSIWASAQAALASDCALPPGTIALGKYCAAKPAVTAAPAPAATAGPAAQTTPAAQTATGLAATNDTPAKPPAVAQAIAMVPPGPVFRLNPPETVRSALERWSKQAQWTFGLELWGVPVDIPVVTPADMGHDYRAAVRKLLDSTALTDAPLQPCFYSNKVLRVVSRSQLCDRL
jgi:hypothetical protein